jgi:hypothetical protein
LQGNIAGGGRLAVEAQKTFEYAAVAAGDIDDPGLASRNVALKA